MVIKNSKIKINIGAKKIKRNKIENSYIEIINVEIIHIIKKNIINRNNKSPEFSNRQRIRTYK